MQALLGTRLAADLNLVAQILMLAGLWAGFYFARTKQRTRHKNMQTTVVLAQLFFIFFVMVTSFYNYVVAGRTFSGVVAQLMILHGGLGLVAEVSGIYLLLRMRTQLIPARFRVRNFKLVMRSTLGLWTVIALLGFGVYYFRYLQEPATEPAPVPILQLRLAVDDLLTHASELDRAISRRNLNSAKRHAEHLVLLAEGRTGEHYGDLDGDGTVEDPGDGTGILVYLQQFEQATSDQAINERVGALRELVERVNTTALSVAGAVSLATVEGSGRQAVATSRRASDEVMRQLESDVERAGLRAASLVSPAVPAASAEPQTVTVLIDQFQFIDRNITIGEGWTVIWTNNESAKHTATADDDRFNSGSLGKGDTFSFTFADVGIFQYYCRFHGDTGGVGMAGTVTVVSASESSSVPPPAATATPRPTPEPAAAVESTPTSSGPGPTPAALAPTPIATPLPTLAPPTPTITASPAARLVSPTNTPTVSGTGATGAGARADTPTAVPTPEAAATLTPTPSPTATPSATKTPEATTRSIHIRPSRDNTLYEDAAGSLSNGAGQHIFVGKNNSGSVRRGVMAFDVAGQIPLGSKIESVSLKLFLSRTQASVQTIRLHKLTSDWGEGSSATQLNPNGSGGGGGTAATSGDATWVHTFFDATAWTSPGGDYSPAISAEIPVGGAGPYDWTSDSMSADVQSWLDGPSTNFGWIIIGNETDNQTAKRFDSKERTVEGNQPVLTVSFTTAK